MQGASDLEKHPPGQECLSHWSGWGQLQTSKAYDDVTGAGSAAMRRNALETAMA